MSGQQSMFVDPEHQDSEQRMQNRDPREQEGYGEGLPVYGGEEYYQGQSSQAKIQPQQRKKPRLLLLIVLLFVVGMFVFGGFSYFAMHNIGGQAQSPSGFQQPSRETLLTGEMIVIRGNTSDVHVHTTSGNDVIFSETGKNNAVNITHEGGEMVISVVDRGGPFGDSPNLDVMIPQNGEALQVEDNSGNVELENISGAVQVTTSSGDIHAQNLNGSSNLQSNSGDITVRGINGKAQVSTSAGDVDVSQANFDGSSVVSTNSGSITYQGTLSANSPYQFSTSSGDVKLNLDGDAGLKVAAQTQSGDLHNEFGSGAGNVQINTASGDITVHKGS